MNLMVDIFQVLTSTQIADCIIQSVVQIAKTNLQTSWLVWMWFQVKTQHYHSVLGAGSHLSGASEPQRVQRFFLSVTLCFSGISSMMLCLFIHFVIVTVNGCYGRFLEQEYVH